MRKWWMFALFALLATAPAWASELEAQEVLGPYPAYGVIASGSLEFTMASIITPVTTTLVGNEVLLAYNSGVSSASLSIDSVADEFGALGDIDVTIPSASAAAFYFGNRRGWDDGTGVGYSSSGADVVAAVLRLPKQPKHIQPASAAVSYPSDLLEGPYPGIVAPSDLLVTRTAGAGAQGYFLATGGDLLIAHNTSGATATLTIQGSRDTSPYHRARTITYVQDDDEWSAFWFGEHRGWTTSAGVINISTTSADQKITVLRVP